MNGFMRTRSFGKAQTKVTFVMHINQPDFSLMSISEIKKLKEKEGTKKRKNQKVAAETSNASDKETSLGNSKSDSLSTLSLLSPEDDPKYLFDDDGKTSAYGKVGSESRKPLAKSSRSRGQKRKHASTSSGNAQDFERPEEEHDEHEGMDAASIREHEEVTKVKVEVTSSLLCVACN